MCDFKLYKKFPIILLFFLLSACTSTHIQSHVESFGAFDTVNYGDKLFIAPYHSSKHQELEQNTWVELAQIEIKNKGYTIVDDAKNATILAIVGLDIDSGKDVSYTYSIPQFGVIGNSASNTSATATTFGNMTTYSANTTYTPQYGIVGYNNGIGHETIFNRTAAFYAFRIMHDGKPKLIYSSRLSSNGSCSLLSTLAPLLIKSLLVDFPLTHSGTVQYKFDSNC
ncbi:hypothetical protein [Acetobacter peroxydans]|uniref:Lipoprotein n=1 Tax=Acetobacter peroxydans TaxID=104098 RepID=A0A4Y3TV76_9PROT|nr:hypothetical protein [Acetobacter peroxydans]NHO16202.1 hypothetical protein [Acetobacter peroxydans]GBR34224.1 hypothetical protein AA13755_0793 [Acetobacter peroxydans NBRC 13755]GBR40675.1 hypothetical protein AA0475_0739 [Acetobacter peroxydans]GEB85693.1 hypothetical protein APE01nite_14900 [Acetobacter peroxydans]